MIEVEERNVRILSWFVVRARRVEEHSLLEDIPSTVRWMSGTATVSQVEGRAPTVTWDLPPEEALDSLAARCRPFLLAKDPVYWRKVAGALGYYLRDPDDELAVGLQHVRNQWQKLDPSTPDRLGYESRAGRVGGQLGAMVTDKALAYAWLYGDLVHADDDLPDRVGEHDIDSRFHAGSLLIATTATSAVATLNIIRRLRKCGGLDLPDEIFTRRVKATPKPSLTVTAMVSGPVGTSAADLEAVLDGRAGP